jgi:hypothetical protein
MSGEDTAIPEMYWHLNGPFLKNLRNYVGCEAGSLEGSDWSNSFSS